MGYNGQQCSQFIPINIGLYLGVLTILHNFLQQIKPPNQANQIKISPVQK